MCSIFFEKVMNIFIEVLTGKTRQMQKKNLTYTHTHTNLVTFGAINCPPEATEKRPEVSIISDKQIMKCKLKINESENVKKKTPFYTNILINKQN